LFLGVLHAQAAANFEAVAQLLSQHFGHLPGMVPGRQVAALADGVTTPVHPSVGDPVGSDVVTPSPGGSGPPPSQGGSGTGSSGGSGASSTLYQNTSRVTHADVVNR
jgi:hypothetical protein